VGIYGLEHDSESEEIGQPGEERESSWRLGIR
jgi:hypothetical protein